MKKLNKGQSMFELLIAVFVIGISLTAIVRLVTTSISNTTFSRDRTVAAKHIQDVNEWLREQRDISWGEFIAKGSSSGKVYCMQTLTWDEGGCSSSEVISGTNMRREVTIIYNSGSNPDTVEARMAITWQDQSGTHESRVTTYFSNWRTK